MRLAFFGTPAYAVPTLDALAASEHEVVTVVAQPDRPSGRGKKMQSPPVVVRARELGIETRQPKGVRSGPFPRNYGALELDLAVVVAYGRILTPELLSVPKFGCINGHGSLLPRWRGAGPIQWSLLSGDAQTGVCVMQMDAGMDTGDVLLREAIDIGQNETQSELGERLSQLTARLCLEAVNRYAELTAQPQVASGMTHARMLAKTDALMDWSRSAQELHNQVRGLNPWPGTQTTFRGEVFKIKVASVGEEPSSEPPGTVIHAGAHIAVSTGQGVLWIHSAQLPGKPARGARQLVNGARIAVGEVFGG
ncbi:MAG: methionyl-tRNA formyltransferase [Cognaticolwellia sp.]